MEKTFSGLRAIRPFEAMTFLLPVIGSRMEKLKRRRDRDGCGMAAPSGTVPEWPVPAGHDRDPGAGEKAGRRPSTQ